MKVLKTNKLTKIYGKGETEVKAVNNVNIEIEEKEFVAIVGTSGSGKSTLLHLLGGLDVPTSGEVIINDLDINKLNDNQLSEFRRKSIGFIFQQFNLIPVLNVVENIKLPLSIDNIKIDEKFLDELLELLNLSSKKKSFPNQLSGGQMQRVAIARSLIAKPKIILADEPTGNLDKKTSEEVLTLLKKSAKLYNQTLIMITHDNNIAKMADRIIRIEDGKVYEE